jgi:parvulin-like peptidyl-prolyl isomerase
MFKLAKASLLVTVATLSLSASDILLTVNGENITKQQAQAFVTAAAPNAKYTDLAPQEQEMIKERLVEKVLFSELAKKEKIEEDSEFKKNLEMIKAELMLNIWMKKQMDNVVVSDSEAKEFYEKNKEKFTKESTAQARHILLKEEQEAQAIIDELKSLNGKTLKEKFIELATSKSTGPSASRGGDLGTFTKGQMVPEFSNAVWSMNNGEVSAKPVKTQFGYHVIYLEERTEAAIMPYEEMKEKIVATLRQKQFSTKITEMSKELRSKADIVDHTKKTENK